MYFHCFSESESARAGELVQTVVAAGTKVAVVVLVYVNYDDVGDVCVDVVAAQALLGMKPWR